jgi:hypothetical protein
MSKSSISQRTGTMKSSSATLSLTALAVTAERHGRSSWFTTLVNASAADAATQVLGDGHLHEEREWGLLKSRENTVESPLHYICCCYRHALLWIRGIHCQTQSSARDNQQMQGRRCKPILSVCKTATIRSTSSKILPQLTQLSFVISITITLWGYHHQLNNQKP